jgi:hypothetical protein
MVAVGFLPGSIALMCALVVPSDAPNSAAHVLDIYPALMVVAGLSFFIVGSTHWSVFLWLGLGVMALAPVAALWRDEAPFVCGVSVSACLLYWSYALRYTFGARPAAAAAKSAGPSVEYQGVRRSDPASRGRGGHG